MKSFETGRVISEEKNKKESAPDIKKLWSRGVIYEDFGKRYRQIGMDNALDHFFKSLNISPVFSKQLESPEKFLEMRKKLHEEPGIIISNHPGFFDMFLILKALEGRDDYKILVKPTIYENRSRTLGENHVVSVKSKDPSKKNLDHFLESAKEAISNGELFLFFPTAGNERQSREFDFKRGLTSLVKEINPATMIYCFYVNYGDVENTIGPDWRKSHLRRDLRYAGANMENTFRSEKINFNKLTKPKEIEVDEMYTESGEWKDSLSEAANPEEALTDHYLKIFGLNKRLT